MNGGGPYRQGPPVIKHVCTLCLRSYSIGPGECSRCRVLRMQAGDPEAYSAMLEEAHKRVAVPRLRVDPLLEERQHQAPPDGRALEDLSIDELIAWLGMELQRS